jgi:alpha-tubulin suppressor-like RCC1 family protein
MTSRRLHVRLLALALVAVSCTACIRFEWGRDLDGIDTTPTEVDREAWIDLDVGETHGCGVQADRSLWCWGQDGAGQIGDGDDDVVGRHPATRVGTSTWLDVAVGYLHTCGVTTDGALWCWGMNDAERRELGIAEVGNHPAPVLVDDGPFDEVSAGWSYSCAIRADDDALWCWGRLRTDFGTTEPALTEPTRVGTDAWDTLSSGQFHICGVRTDRSLWCWGSGAYGELANGSETIPLEGFGSAVPSEVGGQWRDIGVGGFHSCGIRSDGSLWCWGLDADGITDYRGVWWSPDPGENGVGFVVEPHRVGMENDWRTVTGGEGFVCGIRGTTPASLWCWGRNADGQLGVGDTVARDEPTRIDPARHWILVEAGGTNVVAVAVDTAT